MKKQSKTIKYILSFFLVLSALFLAGKQKAVSYAAGSDRIYYFNMSADGVEGSMILVETDGCWGLLDAGHRQATTIQDANGATYSTAVNGLSSQIYCRNGKDVANYMINNLGVTHLDFIVGTHAHSDHVGGIPEVAATFYRDAYGVTHYLVDSRTTYYYKEYQHISDVEDDLARYSSDSWHNQAFAWQAKTAMANQGANLVDVSSAQVIHGDPGNAYGDYVTFRVGNMSFRLYNVHEQTNTGNENVNSIVTVLTNGYYSVVNLADIDTGNGAIDRTSQAIAKDFGMVDIVVAGHHGYAGSNTKTMFDSLQPSFVIVPNGMESSWVYTDCDLAAAIPYAQGRFGTAFYNLSISPYAVVTDLTGQQVYVYSVSGSGDLTNAINSMMQSVNKTGWVSWVNTEGTLWSYLENGQSVKNDWRRVNGKMYHFDNTGIMNTGWYSDGGGTRYLDGSGALVTGWDLIDGRWYYFESYYGYRLHDCWQRINGKVYYFDGDGAMHVGWHTDGGGRRYLDGSGALVTGWQFIDGAWYYFESDYGYLQVLNGWQRQNGKLHYYENGAMLTGWYDDGTGVRYLSPDDGSLVTGWRAIDGSWYYFDSYYGYRAVGWQRIGKNVFYFNGSGVMQTGWVSDGGGRRYLNGSGALVTGWNQLADCNWYYFEKEYGYCLQNCWERINGKVYYFNPDGTMHTGWHTDAGGTRYLDENGALVTGWRQIDGVWYFFEDENGYNQPPRGWQRLNGTLHFFDDDGTMHTGWLSDETGNHYLAPEDGSLVTGWRWIDGAWYYFDAYYGSRVTGWQRIDGKVYYFNEDGLMQTGWLAVDGMTRYLDESGVLLTGWQQLGGVWYYFYTEDGSLARDTVVDGYYVDANGVWSSN